MPLEIADNFMISVVSKARDEATLINQMKMFPGIAEMNKIIVI
jgi:hypothetical protein